MDSRCLIRDDETKQGPLWTSGHASPGHSLREGREGSACVVGAALWDGETYQLVSRQGQDADHEMAGDPGMSADADMAPATLILEAGVGPLDTGPDPDPHGLGIDMAYCTPVPGLPVSRLLEVLVPARIDIDDRHMAKPFTHLVDLPGIIGRVHEIVEIGHTPGGHHRQRDRDLAVMDGCRGENGPQRHPAVCCVDRQLVTAPSLQDPLAVFFAP